MFSPTFGVYTTLDEKNRLNLLGVKLGRYALIGQVPMTAIILFLILLIIKGVVEMNTHRILALTLFCVTATLETGFVAFVWEAAKTILYL